MHPAVCDQPEGTVRGRVFAEIELDVMFTRDALVLSTLERIEVVSVQLVYDARYVLPLLISGARNRLRC